MCFLCAVRTSLRPPSEIRYQSNILMTQALAVKVTSHTSAAVRRNYMVLFNGFACCREGSRQSSSAMARRFADSSVVAAAGKFQGNQNQGQGQGGMFGGQGKIGLGFQLLERNRDVCSCTALRNISRFRRSECSLASVCLLW